jgi:DNA-directed RNA polymerase subunit beta'
LMALEHTGLKPNEAYMMNYVPVLPPIFRPIIPMPDGSLRFDDINAYYKHLGHINNQLKTPIKELPDEENNDLREQLYDVVKALSGLGGKPVYESNRKMKGILDQIAGDQPKLGYFQRKLMKRRQDLSMRSTIIPEPAMHLDHVGLPKEAALELYKPFVIREMQSMGYTPLQSLKEIKAGTDITWKALQSAMDKRPILLKRDPALHKFSIMAFKPRIVEGKAIQIHPLVTAGYNADFDGDTMSAFVPLTDEAVLETHKMFPSNNLFSSTHGGIMYAPDQESLMGLNLLSKWGKHSGKSFSTFQDAPEG